MNAISLVTAVEVNIEVRLKQITPLLSRKIKKNAVATNEDSGFQ